MAKNKETTETALAGRDAQGGGAMERSAIGGSIVAGRDSSASIAQVVMYQGTPTEEQMYGSDFKRGEFIETLEKRSYGFKVEIVCIGGWMSWAKFVDGQIAPEYSHTNKSDVPPEDLEWQDDGGGKRSPPAATETVNMVVLVNGEPFPSLFRFKRTGLKAYGRTIEPSEKRFGRCVYELAGVDDKNANNQAYKRLTAKMLRKIPEGDPILGVVNAIESEFKASRARFEAAAEPTHDETPI